MGNARADTGKGASLNSTIESTIARLHRSGFAPERIADMLGLEHSIVRDVLPSSSGDADLLWLPTEALRSDGRGIVALRAMAKLEVGARAEEYADEEIRLLRLATRHGMTCVQLSAAMTRLGNPRSDDSIAHAAKKYGITRIRYGTSRWHRHETEG